MTSSSILNEFKSFFPNETGRVLGYPVNKGTSAIHSIIENGSHIPHYFVEPTSLALMPDQIEDFAFYRALAEHDRAKGVHDFAAVIVQSGMLEEGITL